MAEGYTCSQTTMNDTNLNRSPRYENNRQSSMEISNSEQRNIFQQARTDSCNNMRPICRYFKKGTCQYGDRCRFSHCDMSKLVKVSPVKKEEGLHLNQNEEIQSASTSSNSVSIKRNLSDWVNAPEFIPSKNVQNKSYAQIVNPNNDDDKNQLCPYEISGVCTLPEGQCQYLHSEICDLCGQPALHPLNTEERKRHTQECVEAQDYRGKHKVNVCNIKS